MAAYQHRAPPLSRDPLTGSLSRDADGRIADTRYDPLVPIGDRYNPSYLNARIKIESLQQCEERMNQLHEQNLHLAQKIERVATRLEELARGGVFSGRGVGPGYYQGQGNAYYNASSRYLDGGPNSASYMDSVRDADRRGRYDPTLGGPQRGIRHADDRSWGGEAASSQDKMETSEEKEKSSKHEH